MDYEKIKELGKIERTKEIVKKTVDLSPPPPPNTIQIKAVTIVAKFPEPKEFSTEEEVEAYRNELLKGRFIEMVENYEIYFSINETYKEPL